MTKPIPPLDLSWLLIESPAGTTHVGAMLLFKKPAGRGPIVREIVEAYRACPPAPPFNYVPELLVRGVPHFREVASWDPYYHIGHLALPAGASYDDLLRLVADLHEPQLDRDRPLFRCWVIDQGCTDRMFAIYTKTHHSIIDGEAGLKRLYAGLSTSDRHTVPTPGFALSMPEPAPHPPTPLVEKIADSIRRASRRSRHSTRFRSARCARCSPRYCGMASSRAACRSWRSTPRPTCRSKSGEDSQRSRCRSRRCARSVGTSGRLSTMWRPPL